MSIPAFTPDTYYDDALESLRLKVNEHSVHTFPEGSDGQELRWRDGAPAYVRTKEAFLNDRADIDKTGTDDMASTIQTYLNEYKTAGVRTVYCDSGSSYRINSSISLPSYMKLEGPNYDYSVGEGTVGRAQFLAGASGITMFVQGSFSSLSGLKLNLGRPTYSGNVGTFLGNSTVFTTVEHCLFGNADATGTGIKMGGVIYVHIDGCMWSDGFFGRGIDALASYDTGGSPYYGVNVGLIERCNVGASAGAIRIEGQCHIRNCAFEVLQDDVVPYCIELVTPAYPALVRIDGCYFESGRRYIRIENDARVYITNNEFHGTATYGPHILVDGATSNLRITDNYFSKASTFIDLGPGVYPSNFGTLIIESNGFGAPGTAYVAGGQTGIHTSSGGNSPVVRIQRGENRVIHQGAQVGSAVWQLDTSIDLLQGNFFHLDVSGGGTLTASNAYAGQHFSVYFQHGTWTVPNATFRLMSGADETPPAGTVKHFVVDRQHNIREVGRPKGAALTAADAGTVNSGDATTDTVINNLRTRLGELEDRLQDRGVIA